MLRLKQMGWDKRWWEKGEREKLPYILRFVVVVVVVYTQVRSAINPILSFQTFAVISVCMLIAEPKSSAKTVDKCSALRLP